MLFSVVIPLYNKEAFIAQTLASVLAQSERDFEAVVVDDGSRDQSAAIVEALAAQDPRIRLIRQPNGGEGAARNRGIAESRGELCALLDADDTWEPDFLAAIRDLKAAFPEAAMFGTGHRLVFPGGKAVEMTLEEARRNVRQVLVENYFYRAHRLSFFNSSCVAIRREVLIAEGGFVTGEPYGADLELWGRLKFHGCKLAYDTRILSNFRQLPMAQKPRFQSPPRHVPVCSTLLRLAREQGRSLPEFPEAWIYARGKIRRLLLYFAVNFSRETLPPIIATSRAQEFAPLLSRLVQLRMGRFLAQIWHQFNRVVEAVKARAHRGNWQNSRGVLRRSIRIPDSGLSV